MTPGESLGIGEVAARLEGEFPEITISKVRYLEARGLVEPHRTPAGYRQFSVRDLELLRWILTQQRDSFLPLKVIADKIDRGDFTQPDDVDAPTARRPRVDPLVSAPRLALSAAELRERAGIEAAMLAGLEKVGLVEPQIVDGRPSYGSDDLAIAEIAAVFGAQGIEPRHLRAYKTAADREVALMGQRTAALDPESTRLARAELVQLGDELRCLLLRRQLQGDERGKA